MKLALVASTVAFMVGAVAPAGAIDVAPDLPTDYLPWLVQVEGKSALEWQQEAAEAQARIDELDHKLRRRNAELRRQWDAFRRWRATKPWGHHPLEVSFLCIHEHEARWEWNGPIYDGGLQMDSDFQSTYGAEFLRYFGPAYLWPRAVQIAVAIRGYMSGRRFGPWPTRRFCGL